MRTASTGDRGEIPALTSLRAVAALLVFLYHFPPQQDGLLSLVAREGRVGVTVFFVLSGFLITVRYFDRFARGEVRLSEYFVKRVARIVPLYYTVLALSYFLSTGSVPFDLDRLPEWTLTHALFGEGMDSLVVPTSWSLTVEECFYATAPLLFLTLLVARRRLGSAAGTVIGLAAWTTLLFGAGTLTLGFAPALLALDFGFLNEAGALRMFTIFGRFFDFALGCGCGLLLLSGRVEAQWQRRSGPLAATLLGLAGGTLLVTAEAWMSESQGGDPLAIWRANLGAVVASAAIILALTCRRGPLARLLAAPPFVYLGRVSYAFYLIQLTPLGRGLMFRLFPGDTSLVVLYLAMSAVSALLFELVEEPARQAILRLWRGQPSLPAVRLPRPLWRAISLTGIVLGLTFQQATWVLDRLDEQTGPQSQAAVLGALGDRSPAVMIAPALQVGRARDPRVWLPPEWRIGRLEERRAPWSLLVFVDRTPVPFVGTRAVPTQGDVAYYRGPRSSQLNLRSAAASQVVVIDNRPGIALTLAWARLSAAPASLLSIALLALAAVVAGRIAWAWWPACPPRSTRLLGLGLAALWLMLEVQTRPWAPVVLGLEFAALLLPALLSITPRLPPRIAVAARR